MMKRPPSGAPMLVRRPDLDAADSDTLKQLAAEGRCQQRLLTDGGQHYVYCGGYFDGATVKTRHGLRCAHHRPR